MSYLERNARIVAWAAANPCSTLQEIGDYYGLTRERVRRIIALAGAHKPPKRRVRHFCDSCGVESKAGSRRKNRPTPYRCASCVHTLGWVQIACRTCGVLFPIRKSRLLSQVKLFTDPVRYCQSCRNPPCVICGRTVDPKRAYDWRRKRYRPHCEDHIAKTRRERALRGWESRRKSAVVPGQPKEVE